MLTCCIYYSLVFTEELLKKRKKECIFLPNAEFIACRYVYGEKISVAVLRCKICMFQKLCSLSHPFSKFKEKNSIMISEV